MTQRKAKPTEVKPRVPLGKPLDWSDEDLDTLAEVTPEDIENIKREVKKISPLLGALLDAKVIKRTQKKRPRAGRKEIP